MNHSYQVSVTGISPNEKWAQWCPFSTLFVNNVSGIVIEGESCHMCHMSVLIMLISGITPKSTAVMTPTAAVTDPACLSNGPRYYIRRCRYATPLMYKIILKRFIFKKKNRPFNDFEKCNFPMDIK